MNRTCGDADLVSPSQLGLGRGDDAAVVPTVRLQQVVNAQQETLHRAISLSSPSGSEMRKQSV